MENKKNKFVGSKTEQNLWEAFAGDPDAQNPCCLKQ